MAEENNSQDAETKFNNGVAVLNYIQKVFRETEATFEVHQNRLKSLEFLYGELAVLKEFRSDNEKTGGLDGQIES